MLHWGIIRLQTLSNTYRIEENIARLAPTIWCDQAKLAVLDRSTAATFHLFKKGTALDRAHKEEHF